MIGTSSAPDDGRIKVAIDRILALGIDGAGRFKSAEEVAREHLAQHGDPEVAIKRVIATHTRLVGATGFAMGLGGVVVLPVTIPGDVGTFYLLSTRCVAAVAHLRGYDVASDEVRSIVLLSLLGASGAGIAAEAGGQLGTQAGMAALRQLPGALLIAINKKVGFRLFTKFGEKGAVNLVKLVPLVGGGVGAGVNVVSMRSIGAYAKRNFPRSEHGITEIGHPPDDLPELGS
jgi:hypothetical protein